MNFNYLLYSPLFIFITYIVGMVYFALKDLAKTSKRGNLLCTQILSSIELNCGGGSGALINMLREYFLWEEMIIFDFFWKRKISIYEGGLSTGILFYRWDEFKVYKIENGYIRLIRNFPTILRHVYALDVYLKYDEELEKLIKNYLKVIED